MRFRKIVLRPVVFVLVYLSSIGLAHAYTFSIDRFYVEKNGAIIFDDQFDDGAPPPSAPNFLSTGGPASYTVTGTMGPENSSSGKLTLDSSGAVQVVAGIGGPDVMLQAARLETNIDPLTTGGLKSSATFGATGIFDLVSPPGIEETYGIRFFDNGDDNIELAVRRETDNNLYVVFRRLDFIGKSATTIASTTLDPFHDQISLHLYRPDLGTNSVYAAFDYLDGGSVANSFTFTQTADIFHGENYTQAMFRAASPAPVPLPGAFWLFASGLAGLLGIRFRK